MKHLLNNSYVVIFLLYHTFSFSQQDAVEKANDAFKNLDYIDAIDIYTSVVESGVEDPKLINKLANAHYFNGNFNAAAKWYERYYNMVGITPTILDNYRYGQALKTQKKYKEADSLLATYYSYKGFRYKSLLNPEEDIDVIDNNDVYQINNFRWNTDLSEYPAYIDQDQLFVVGYNLESKKRRSRITTSNIYALDMAYGEYTPLSEEVNSPYNEGPAVITNDGNTMYFTRNNYEKGRLKRNKDDVVTIDMYIAERKGNGAWKNVKPFPFNDEEYSVGHPALSNDNKTLYFVSNKPGGKGGTDLYKVPVFDDGTFGEPKNMTELNTVGNEMFPFIDKKNSDLYFSSNGPQSLGGLDVFISKLTSDNVYKRSYNLGSQVNSTYDDFSFMIGANRTGYFASNRVNDVGMDDIYSFKTLRDFRVPNFLELKGVITDYDNNDLPLSNVNLTLYDNEGNVMGKTITDVNGNYEFDELEGSKMAYIKAEKDSYQTTEKNITADIVENKKPLELVMLSLGESVPDNIIVSSVLKDEKTGKPISDATITLLDINNNPLGKTKTAKDGTYSLDNVSTNKVAFIRAEKKGYQTEEKPIDLKQVKNGEYNDPINLVKNNVPVQLGNDLASILNTIYFDFAKDEIRQDAAIELEKIVQVLKKFKTLSIQIESHTDSSGRDITNLKLSQRRAKATYNYLISKGINPNRLTYKGFGESQLLNRCKNGVKCSEEEHQLNRRSSFKIEKI